MLKITYKKAARISAAFFFAKNLFKKSRIYFV